MLLRTRIKISYIIFILLMGCITIFVENISTHQTENWQKQVTSNIQHALLKSHLKNILDVFNLQFSSLTRNQELKKSLKDLSISDIQQSVKPSFNRLSTVGLIDSLKISGINGQVLASFPNKLTEITTQLNILSAQQTLHLTQGLSLNHLGEPVISAAMPLTSQGQLIGIAEYAKGLQSVAEQIKENTGMDLFFVNRENKLSASTSQSAWDVISTKLEANNEINRHIVFVDENIYEVISQPVTGFQGQEIGTLISAQEFSAAYTQNKIFQYILYASLLTALLLILASISLYLNKAFAPLKHIVKSLQRLTQGERNINIPVPKYQDEIADIINAVSKYQQNLLEMDRLAEQEHQNQKSHQQKIEKQQSVTDQFQDSIELLLSDVSHAIQSLQTASSDLSHMAEQTTSEVNIVSEASQTTSHNVQQVSRAVDQMSTSISEVNVQTNAAQKISAQAKHTAEKNNVQITELTSSVHQIENVITLINDIANQTNLLALNATIEAARAGDMGKGFSVVANSVKNLANQTSNAVQEIQNQINNVQHSTQNSVDSITEIISTITQIHDVTLSAAGAVDQQNSSNQEIAKSITEVTQSSNLISNSINGVQDAAHQTDALAQSVLQASDQISHHAIVLRERIQTFLTSYNSA